MSGEKLSNVDTNRHVRIKQPYVHFFKKCFLRIFGLNASAFHCIITKYLYNA